MTDYTPQATERKAAFERRFELAVARRYGFKIPDILVPELAKQAEDLTDVALEIYGGDQANADQIAEAVVSQNEMAQRALGAVKDDSAKDKKSAQASWADMQKLRPEERMTRAREGK